MRERADTPIDACDLTPFRALLGSRCADDPARLLPYERPERGTPGHAQAVLLPETEAEVGAILKIGNERGCKFVISAGRTGLVEAQRPEGELVLSLERLNRILSIDPSTATAEVQAGVSIDALNKALEPMALIFPMEMGSSSAATVGACVANGSAGANAVSYGTAAQMCEAAWGWWGSGEPAGPFGAPAWQIPPPEQLAINSARLRIEWGLVGTQGTLGVITRLRVRLVPLPRQREAVLLSADCMADAMRIFDAAQQRFGSDVEEFEFISRGAMETVRFAKGETFRLPLSKDIDPAYYLLLQVKASEVPDYHDLRGHLYDFASVGLSLQDELIGYAPLTVLKNIRHSISESSTHRMRHLGGDRLTFDTAVPRAVFGEYLDRLSSEIGSRFDGCELIAFGHAGVGGAHLHVLGTQKLSALAHADEITRLVLDETHSFGGTFSAEHGVGSKWAGEFLRRTSSPELLALATAKNLCDPNCVLHPQISAAWRIPEPAG